MSLLRRIVQNRTVSKSIPVAKLFVPYPLGRNRSSLPKINPNFEQLFFDRRPISLRYRVTTMIELSNLNEAAKTSHLAVSDKFRGNGDTVFICNSVIGAMCSAKRYDEALSLFNYFFNEYETLPNMLSCNLIMKAHCDLGRVDDALELYRHVLLDGVLAPGVETYRILTKGFVDAKLFDEACDFVSSMSRCDFTVYDILIRGFLDSGKFVKASLILEEVKNVNSRLPWREYHKGIAMFNVSFMNYWFKLGKDEEAMEIYAALDKSEAKNLIVGNRVLEVLVEHGKKTEAWDLFREIEMVEICDSETVEIMLKGFSVTTIPVHRVRKTCYRALIAGFCKEGNMSEAEKLFAEMVSDIERDELIDISTFRALINGYVNAGRVDDAIKMLDKMKIAIVRKLAIHEATCPRALMSRVNYLASGGSLDAAVKYARLAVFSDIEVKVWPHNEEEDEIEFICESIIGSMVEYKRHKDAHDLYDFFFNKHNLKPNMHCCNYILKSRFEQGLVDEALDFHRSAVAFGYPNEDTFRILTKGLVHSGRLDQAETAATTDSSRFHQCNLVDLNTMIQCLLDLWNLDRANKVLKRVWFEFPDDVTLNTLIRGFLDLGNLDKANLVSDELKQLCFQFPDHVAFNYLIRGFLDLGNLDKANLVLSEFKRLWSVTTALSKHSPDSEHENRVAFLMATFMEYWFKQGKEVEAMEIYDRSLFANKFPIDAQTGNAFLEVLFKYGKKEHAWELYREMFDQHDDESLSRGMDMSTVKKMVDECFDMGRCSEAVETYKKAIAKNKFVRGSYIIKRCCEIGMLSEAESLLADGYPNMEKATFKTMMDAYVKAGRIDDAIKTSNKMIDAALEDLPDLL